MHLVLTLAFGAIRQLQPFVSYFEEKRLFNVWNNFRLSQPKAFGSELHVSFGRRHLPLAVST
jgi:hypothetical protein